MSAKKRSPRSRTTGRPVRTPRFAQQPAKARRPKPTKKPIARDDAASETSETSETSASKAPGEATKLPGASLRHLRALGHELTPVVMIGKEGLTDSLVRATSAALLTHELIKVKVQGEAPVDRKEAASSLASACSAVLAQVLGRTFLLYKRHPKTPKIRLPRA